MLRSLASSSVTAFAKRPQAAVQVPVRNLSDRVLKQRMVAVGNIKKITKAMMMVASAKVRKAEESYKAADKFAKGIAPAMPTPTVDANSEKVEIENATNQFVVVAVTPDRGLCGSVNGAVVRHTRARAHVHLQAGKNLGLVGLGEKTKSGLERLFGRNITFTVGEHSKLRRRTFKESAILADLVLTSAPFDQGEIVFNSYKNMISFETTTLPIVSYNYLTQKYGSHFEPYDDEGDSDLLENLYQWTFASRMHAVLSETDIVEFTQRVNSMTNSSKNAEEMLGKLRLLYNRVRQARVTTELVEIISGATAADDAAKSQ